MSIRKLPKIEARTPPKCLQWEESDLALARYSPDIRSAESNNTISILGTVGEDFDGSGFTSRRMAAALRSIGEKDIDVAINSPGGDFFEGVAIYNMLREHKGRVNVKIIGLAASAASIIAMAGDSISIGKAGFMMIHNSWALVMGNRHDLAESIAVLEPFDSAMAAVYADRTGLPRGEVEAMMDGETWFNGEDAVAKGFADGLLAADEIKEEAEPEASGIKGIRNMLARAGVKRGPREKIIENILALRDAGKSVEREADEGSTRDAALVKHLQELAASI